MQKQRQQQQHQASSFTPLFSPSSSSVQILTKFEGGDAFIKEQFFLFIFVDVNRLSSIQTETVSLKENESVSSALNTHLDLSMSSKLAIYVPMAGWLAGWLARSPLNLGKKESTM